MVKLFLLIENKEKFIFERIYIKLLEKKSTCDTKVKKNSQENMDGEVATGRLNIWPVTQSNKY